MSDDALHLVRRRVIVIAAFAWLPLLLLAAAQGNAFGESTARSILVFRSERDGGTRQKAWRFSWTTLWPGFSISSWKKSLHHS
jgi:hypothetical protein